MAKRPEPGPLTIIGLGNPLMADDGIGLAALERLRDQWDLPDHIRLADGGTWGMMLLPTIESAGRLLLLDAVRTGRAPGTVVRLKREDLPLFFAHKISPHQIDLREVLALAELRGTLPAELHVIGIEPELVEMRHGLSPRIEQAMDRMVDAAIEVLREWGAECRLRGVTVDA